MHRSLTLVVIVGLAIAATAAGVPQAAVDACSSLMSNAALRALPNTTLTTATTVSGAFAAPGAAQPVQGLPSFCRVTATLKPSQVSDVKVEIWLPTSGWNQKLQGVGNGGLAGTITYGALATAVKNGYASVSTDTGHVASDTTWLADTEKEKDYGYRAIHGMTVTAKAVVQQFYNATPKRNYFNGCSTGGGQAFGESQLYPEDYDGLLAGAPQDFPTNLRAAGIWEFQIVNNEPANKLPKPALALLTAAVLRKCEAQFGIDDGFLNDPQACRFDPADLICKEAGQDPSTCLTPAQASAVKQIYEGAISAHTKKQIWPGLVRGSEAPTGNGLVGWEAASFPGATPFAPSAQFYSLAVFQDANLDFHTVDIDNAVQMAVKKFPFINHISTDIDPFMRRGGKLLIYHGWADPAVSPLNSVNYYGSLVAAVQRKRHLDSAAALKEAQKSTLLFMVPGMGHCAGGPGPSNFDAMTALDQWVDQGVAPTQITASHQAGGAATFTRPLCPYPQVAEYNGSGSRTDASNWTCKARPFVFDASFYKVQ